MMMEHRGIGTIQYQVTITVMEDITQENGTNNIMMVMEMVSILEMNYL